MPENANEMIGANMRCKNCKYWCEGEADIPGFGECKRWFRGYYIKPEEVTSKDVIVECDMGWGNETGPDFGCVLFEKSDK